VFEAAIANQIRQALRFVRDMDVGDTVLAPGSRGRKALIGQVAGEHRFDGGCAGEHYPSLGDVKGRGCIACDKVSDHFEASIGSISPVLAVEGHEGEIERPLAGGGAAVEESEKVEEEAPAIGGGDTGAVVGQPPSFGKTELEGGNLTLSGEPE